MLKSNQIFQHLLFKLHASVNRSFLHPPDAFSCSIFESDIRIRFYLKSQFSKSFQKLKNNIQRKQTSSKKKKNNCTLKNMHCPFKIFQNWHLIRMYTCNNVFSSIFLSWGLFSPCLRWVWPKKCSKSPLRFFSSIAHSQYPATFHWLEKITRPRDQVLLCPFLESPSEKQVESSSCYILFAFPRFPNENTLSLLILKEQLFKIITVVDSEPKGVLNYLALFLQIRIK
jgi:hypothetical protein